MRDPMSTAPRTPQHESGDSGERLFVALLPAQYVVHSYKGTEDYGVDFHVEVFAAGKPTGLEFAAQVRTIEAFPGTSAPSLSLKIRSLVYLASKPYPTMLALVSRSQKVARFAWLSELLSASELVRQIQSGGDRKGRLRLRLTASFSLEGAAPQIESYLQQRRAALLAWLTEAEHRRQLMDLYLDLHAALDCLIECAALREKTTPPPDEVWHKVTFTASLVVVAYRQLHGLTAGATFTSFPPALTLLATRKALREILVTIHSEQDIAHLEKHPDQAGLAKYTIEVFWPALSSLLCLFRECLGALAHFLAPWRDFNMQMSGVARSVIEYRGEASHLWRRADSQQERG